MTRFTRIGIVRHMTKRACLVQRSLFLGQQHGSFLLIWIPLRIAGSLGPLERKDYMAWGGRCPTAEDITQWFASSRRPLAMLLAQCGSLGTIDADCALSADDLLARRVTELLRTKRSSLGRWGWSPNA